MSSRTAWPSGYALRHFDEIDSTNDEARRIAEAGEPGPVWIVADRQSAGRGRRGRSWSSPAGNLAATLFLRPRCPAAECAQLSFVAAVAAAGAISGIARNSEVRLKWPNDVLAEGRKIAGILLESASGADRKVDWLAVGIGINLSRHPTDTEFPATSLPALGYASPPARDALTLLAVEFARWYDIWLADGFPAIRDAWLARAAGLGTRIRARLQHEETSGVFEGIDSQGAMILRETSDRVRLVAAGDVFFP